MRVPAKNRAAFPRRALSAFAGLSCAAACAFGAGCATIFSGTKQEIRIDSDPRGAELFVNGQFAGYTPVSVEVARDEPTAFVLKNEGYADTRVRIRRGVNWVVLTDAALLPLFFIGAPIWGTIIDIRSGATRSYKETDVSVPLLLPSEKRMFFYGGNVLLTNTTLTRTVREEEESWESPDE